MEYSGVTCKTCGGPVHFNRITQDMMHDKLDDEFNSPHGWHPVNVPGLLDIEPESGLPWGLTDKDPANAKAPGEPRARAKEG